MDPGWPPNPANSLICILCKSAMPFDNVNPERFFRHLLADHSAYFNLNLLLEISLMQPQAVREEDQIVHEGFPDFVSKQNSIYQDSLQIKHEVKSCGRVSVEPDSTTNYNQRPENCNEAYSTVVSSQSQGNCSVSTISTVSNNVSISPGPSLNATVQPVKVKGQEDAGDFDLSFFINHITQPNGKDTQEMKPSSATFIPFESKPNLINLQSGLGEVPSKDIKIHESGLFTMTVKPDFSGLDPISFVKYEPKSKRKMTRELTVNKNNQPIPSLPDNPNRHLVPEDLQELIVNQNPARRIKFTYSQRMNTQMVVDDYVLKKKKGPYLTRGGRVVNWKCINDACQYTAVTWEGHIQDQARHHNHPSQPELFIKKQARAKIRETMAHDASNSSQEDSAVTNAVMDVVIETSPEMRNKIGSIDALKQAARRYNRKLQKDTQHTFDGNMMLATTGEAIVVPASVYENYEIVGEFPADYQFSTETPTVNVEYSNVSADLGATNTSGVLNSSLVTDNITLEEQVVKTNFESSEVDSEKRAMGDDEMASGFNASEEDLMEKSIKEGVNVAISQPKDSVEELLEPSPTKQDQLVDEFIV